MTAPTVRHDMLEGKTAKPFVSREVLVQSWFAAARSRSLRRGCARSFDLLNRRVAVYRDGDGVVHALDARCPHLGADLGQGRVSRDTLRCAFHGWCFGPDGLCRDAPGHDVPPARRVASYPAMERWGVVWVFHGPTPLFELPAAPRGERWWHLRLPPRRVACHPHMVIANGLDAAHYETLHGIALTEAPRLTTAGPCHVSLDLRGRPRSRMWQALSGSSRHDIVARFTAIGGHVAWVTVFEPIRFHVLFSGRPDRDGACITRTILLFPARLGVRCVHAVGLMAALLHDDRRVLEGLEFSGRFTARDEPLRLFAETVNAMPTW